MPQLKIIKATIAQTENVIRWLKDEHIKELESKSGFYFNRKIIRKAARDGDMQICLYGNTIIGFSVFGYNRIDILEIRSKYRRKGYGRRFAGDIIKKIFESGSNEVHIHCVPEESQHFWRTLGFVDLPEKYRSNYEVRLVLQKPESTNNYQCLLQV